QDLVQGLGGSLILLTIESNLEKNPALLDQAAEKFAAIPGLKIEKKARRGLAREAVVAESLESRPAITVVPPAGRRGLARMIKGSRVKAVVHNSPSTVMIARKPVSDHIKSVLVTVSGGPMSEPTAMAALEVAKALRAQITLLHVTSSVTLPHGNPGEDPRRANVLRLRELLTRAGMEPRMRNREGMVVNEILEECHDGGYDLLILGQHIVDRESGGPFSENIAEDLALECPIPVLVVRPRRWAEGAATGQPETPVPAK
ncbi:MAG TPA: universal stress protein, partial [Planctomycetota bacterium]|nr:universal stress protein [Planctomycetota bacterium]